MSWLLFRIDTSAALAPSCEEQLVALGVVNVLLHPGLAFGTGTHPTTAMCVRAIAELQPLGKRK